MPQKTPNNQIKRSYSESTEEAGSQSGGSNGRLVNLDKRWGRTRGPPIKVSFQAREVVCVRTSGRQTFVPVAFKHFAGEDCALINSGGKVTWLARVLHRQQRDEYDTSLVVRAFDAKIRERLKQLAEQAFVAPHDHEQQGATLAQESGKPNVMSDSENSDGSPDSGETTAAPQARRQLRGQYNRKRKLGCLMGFTIDVLGWTAVDLGGGVSLKLAAARNQPGLITPLRVQNITDLLDYLDKSYSQLLAAGRGLQAEQQEQLDAMGAPATSEVGAPVRYNIQHESYLIVYQDSSGKIAKTERGLHCPRVQNGEYVSPEAYAALKKHKLGLARKMWNAMDHSGAPRLDIPDPD